MKRRTFIKSLAGLFAATQVPSVLAETHPRTLAAEKALERQIADNLALSSHPMMSIDLALPNSEGNVFFHRGKTAKGHKWVKANDIR